MNQGIWVRSVHFRLKPGAHFGKLDTHVLIWLFSDPFSLTNNCCGTLAGTLQSIYLFQVQVLCWMSVTLAFGILIWALSSAVLRYLQLKEHCAASIAQQQQQELCTLTSPAWDTLRLNWRSRPGNASPNPCVICSVSWELQAFIRVYTL